MKLYTFSLVVFFSNYIQKMNIFIIFNKFDWIETENITSQISSVFENIINNS